MLKPELGTHPRKGLNGLPTAKSFLFPVALPNPHLLQTGKRSPQRRASWCREGMSRGKHPGPRTVSARWNCATLGKPVEISLSHQMLLHLKWNRSCALQAERGGESKLSMETRQSHHPQDFCRLLPGVRHAMCTERGSRQGSGLLEASSRAPAMQYVKQNTEWAVFKSHQRKRRERWVPAGTSASGEAWEEAALEPGPEELGVFWHTEMRWQQRIQGSAKRQRRGE